MKEKSGVEDDETKFVYALYAIEMDDVSDGWIINEEVSAEAEDQFRSISKECYEEERVLNPAFRDNNMMTILLNKATQIQSNPRRLSVAKKEKFIVILDDLLSRGIIRKFKSHFSMSKKYWTTVSSCSFFLSSISPQ